MSAPLQAGWPFFVVKDGWHPGVGVVEVLVGIDGVTGVAGDGLCVEEALSWISSAIL